MEFKKNIRVACIQTQVSLTWPYEVLHQINGNFKKIINSIAYAPINGLPQDGGAGQPTGIRLRKAHVGGDFDIHNGPQGGKFDSTAILKSGEDLGMSEWSAVLENTQRSFERVSRIQGWLNER